MSNFNNKEDTGHRGNKRLKRSGKQIEWSPERMREYQKCADDPAYFAKEYIKIVHPDHGLVPFDMYDYQKEILEKITNNRKLAVLTARQSGKCLINTTVIKLRNKKTGEIIETTVENFYEDEKENNN